ncbi:hypothetical protein GJ179_11565 [Salmonella enterica subsp. enterica]|nr:hypothetical protein [Salmonella enterica subsp. enterica]EEL2516771.1 hypothetical protein [Salmonella enterica]EEO4172600.1 hypothetical protein [Salmonella enterica subsp. enterica]EIO8741056.1 hypothetical protein [Salmonella enterica]
MDGKLFTSDSFLNGQPLHDTVVVDAIRQAAYQQHGVIANIEHMKHPTMASGYRELDKPVSVEICIDSKCNRLDMGTLLGPVRQ